jgi:hypothetical protein
VSLIPQEAFDEFRSLNGAPHTSHFNTYRPFHRPVNRKDEGNYINPSSREPPKVFALYFASTTPVKFESLSRLNPRIHKNSKTNLMGPDNLATVVGPNIIPPGDSEDPVAYLNHNKFVVQGVSLLIEHHEKIFPGRPPSNNSLRPVSPSSRNR